MATTIHTTFEVASTGPEGRVYSGEIDAYHEAAFLAELYEKDGHTDIQVHKFEGGQWVSHMGWNNA